MQNMSTWMLIIHKFNILTADLAKAVEQANMNSQKCDFDHFGRSQLGVPTASQSLSKRQIVMNKPNTNINSPA